MKFTVDVSALGFLNILLRNPENIGTNFLGGQFKHYCANSKTDVQIMLTLRAWIEDQMKPFIGISVGKDWSKEFVLSDLFYKKLLEIMDHYKELGNCNVTSEQYWRLRCALEGKNYNELLLGDPSDCSIDDKIPNTKDIAQ